MRILVIITLVLSLFFAIGCESETLEQQVAEYEVLFNQYRAEHDLPPMVFTEDLNKCAALRLEEIKKDFSHGSPGGITKHVAENLVKDINNNEQALACWDDSPGHRYNLLSNDKYSGYAIGDGYALQYFSDYETKNGIPQLPPGYAWPD